MFRNTLLEIDYVVYNEYSSSQRAYELCTLNRKVVTAKY